MTRTRAVLLAAGRANRLRPLTDALPKCLLDVGGRSIARRALGTLAERGIRTFTIVDGFMGDALRAALAREFPAEWFRFVRNDAWETTNNAYSLMLARPTADEAGDDLLLLDSDIVFEPAVVDLMLGGGPENRLALRTRGEIGEEEVKVTLGPDGRIANIAKSIAPALAAGESVGIEVFSPAFSRDLFLTLERRMLVEGRLGEWYEASFVELIQRGAAVHPVDLGDRMCMEVDTPDDLERARRLFG